MRFLADENVESEWISALRDDGHDVERVVDVDIETREFLSPAVPALFQHPWIFFPPVPTADV